MLEILAVWLIVTIFSAWTGIVFIPILFEVKECDLSLVIITGLMIDTIFAELYSIFFAVKSINSLLILSILLLCLTLGNRIKVKFFYENIIGLYSRKNLLNGWLVVKIVVVLSICFITSITPCVYDTYLYHGQAVRWIEEYGIVKGIGNINRRIGFNNSVFYLYALYGFRDMLGETVHSINGFVVTVLSLFTLNALIKRKNIYNVAIACFSLIYVILRTREISSLGTDIYPNVVSLILIMTWIEMIINEKDYDIKLRALICLNFLFLATVKISMIFMFLLVLTSVFYLIKNKKTVSLIKYIFLGLSIVIPFIIGNVLITGWFVFPVYSIDIFSFDWKMPTYTLMDINEAIIKWARFESCSSEYDQYIHFIDWFPKWWNITASLETKLWLVADILLMICDIISYLFKIIKGHTIDIKVLYIQLILFINVIYWLFTAPDIRFCYAIIGVSVMIFISNNYLINVIYNKIFASKLNIRILYVFISILVISGFIYEVNKIDDSNISLVYQNGYKEIDTLEYELSEDVIVYLPIEGSDQTGVNSFPGVNVDPDTIEMRGKYISDGFRMK